MTVFSPGFGVYQLLARCREVAGVKEFRFKNKLLSLDATVIDLCFPTLKPLLGPRMSSDESA